MTTPVNCFCCNNYMIDLPAEYIRGQAFTSIAYATLSGIDFILVNPYTLCYPCCILCKDIITTYNLSDTGVLDFDVGEIRLLQASIKAINLINAINEDIEIPNAPMLERSEKKGWF